MSDKLITSATQRFSFGDHIPMIIANEIDSSEINTLSEQISSSFEIMFGGRASVTYLKETKFLSSFLYNILSIYQDASTPGQDFTGLRLVQVRSPTKQGLLPAAALNASSLLSVLDRIRSMWGQHSRNVYTPLKRELSNSMLLSALVSCIPYLNSRKTTIYATLAELYTALCADETAAVTSSGNSNIDQIPNATESISSRSHAPTSQLLPEDVIPTSSSGLVSNRIGADILPNETAGTEEETSNSTAISSIKKIFIAQRIFRAAIRTFLTASTSPESASILGFFQTVHLFQFLRSGSYYLLALRIMGVRFRKSTSSRGEGDDRVEPKMRMGALTLLLGLHLAVLSAHAAVRFTVELLKEDEIPVEPVAQSLSGRIGGGGVRIIDRSTALHGSQLDSITPSNTSGDALVGVERQGGKETRQCPLCMECMAHPAAPPCGHLFCWECLHTWISSNSSSITGPDSSSVKCPVCRSLFKQQTVRALHGFS